MFKRGNSCVVKLGGSVVYSDQLSSWLPIITNAVKQVVVVPGGGRFADDVRQAQQRNGFNDKIAHERALLAMNKTAEYLACLNDRFDVVQDVPAFHDVLNSSRIPVWAPHQMCIACENIPASWAVTSDSLALWLGATLLIEELYLVKSAPRSARSLTAQCLSEAGLVDEAFPEFLAKAHLNAFYVGPQEKDQLADALRGKSCDFSPIALA